MKRLASLFLAALLAFAPLAQADLRASSGAFGPVAVTSGTGVPVRVFGGGIPFVHAPTGTMANNGAITLGTALSRVIPACWMWLPAGAVAAGVPAAASWLFVQMSSTTVGTVFNNTYTIGSTAAPASPTAFVTTGPGAFTGDITTATGPNVTLGAGAISAGTGVIHAEQALTNNNSAGAKVLSVVLGSTTFWTVSQTTGTNGNGYVNISSEDSTHQKGDVVSGSYHPLGAVAAGVFGTENTATALNLSLKVSKAVATDVAIIERYADWVFAASPGTP